MIKLWGIIDNITEKKKAGNKEFIQVSVAQKESGQKTIIKSLEVWNDSPIYPLMENLMEGEKVEFKCHDFCDKYDGKFTGRIKYMPISMDVIQ